MNHTPVVWLIDYDGKLPNLALMRLSKYHKTLGHTVRLKRGDAYPEMFETPDYVYISCIFAWNARGALRLEQAWCDICPTMIGGTGIDPSIVLPKLYTDEFGTTNVAQLAPDYGLYPDFDKVIGFISRGCIRKCPWCVVPIKEGKLHRVSTVKRLVWTAPEQNRDKLLALDNNFLALPDCESDLIWLADHKVKVDFNQGLDARLVTPEKARLLKACSWLGEGPRLALDSDGVIGHVGRALNFLQEAGMSPSAVTVYVLIGFSGLESDLRRLLYLNHWKASIYSMPFRDLKTGHGGSKGWPSQRFSHYQHRFVKKSRSAKFWHAFLLDMQRYTDFDIMALNAETASLAIGHGAKRYYNGEKYADSQTGQVVARGTTWKRKRIGDQISFLGGDR